MGSIHKFMFGSLPDYFKINDTYKDSSDQGLVERYLESFEEEFEEIKSLITNALDIRDAIVTPAHILQYLSDMMANPPGRTEEEYVRKLLSVIWNLNQIKGTEEGLIKYFRVLGMDVELEYSNLYDTKYDDGLVYDDVERYDTDCNICTRKITIKLSWSDGTPTSPIDDLGIIKIREIILHLIPINILWEVEHLVPPQPLPDTDPFGDGSEIIHYKLEADLVDSEGNFDADNLGTPPSFPDIDGYRVLDTNSLPLYSSSYAQGATLRLQQMSFSMWIYLSDITSKQRIAHWGSRYAGAAYNGNGGFIAEVENDKFQVGFPNQTDVTYDWLSTDGTDDGNRTDSWPRLEYKAKLGWQHVAFVIDNTQVLLYLDGVHKSTLMSPEPIEYLSDFTPPCALLSRVREDTVGTPLVAIPLITPAYASTIRVFNRVLDPGEVEQLANEKSLI